MKHTKVTNLDNLSDEELLSLRFCNLDLNIENTPLKECVVQLYKELEAKGIIFYPKCYFADEWMCPDGEPVVGIAFFLAHPRLRKLEQKMMLEVEGDDRLSCMKLLRHEAGHAINYAYLLHKREKWQKLFGPFSAEYGDTYKYRPYSKSFVRHLEEWYAQYHPDEDFSETFAVWLDPESNWREKYKGWKALTKLEYVDGLINEIAKTTPLKGKGKKYWDIRNLRTTLGDYYRRKQELYREHYADFHDFHLKRIFFLPDETKSPPVAGPAPGGKQVKAKKEKAYKLIRKYRKEILNYVALWTGEKKFHINELLKDLITRSKELSLELEQDKTLTMFKLATYITTQIMNYLYTGMYRRKSAKTKNTRLV